MFSLGLFQVHFASHKVQNTNDTKKEKEKNVTAAAGEWWLGFDGEKGVSTQHELVLTCHLAQAARSLYESNLDTELDN